MKDLKYNKPKDWWREVKPLCGNQQKSTSYIFASLEQDKHFLDSLSNLVNYYFLEPMCEYEPLRDNIFTTTENDSSISLSEEKVFIFLNCVKPGKSGGSDGLPNWVLQTFAAILAKPRSTIINASFKENQVPAC